MDLKDNRVSFLDWLIKGGSIAAAAVILFTMMAVIYEVGMRYFIKKPTSWVIEVVEWCQVWMTFLSAAWVLSKDGHVTMDFVSTRLKTKNQRLLKIITSAIGALICLVLAWFGGQVVWDHFTRGVVEASVLRAPKAPLLAVIPAGFFLMGIQFMRAIHWLLHERPSE